MKVEITRSGMIKSVEYNDETHDLTVEFSSGGKSYVYHKVPKFIFNEILAAESAGKYFLSNIKNKYQFDKN